MGEMQVFIEYLISLFNSLIDEAITLEYDLDDTSDYISDYMLDDSKNFFEFNKNYINCEKYNNIDKKICMGNLMLSTYFMLDFYNNCYNKSDFDLMYFTNDCNLDLFSFNDILNSVDKEEIVFNLSELFTAYLNLTDARRKRIVQFLSNSDIFLGCCAKNEYLLALFCRDYDLKISKEAYLVDDVIQLYDKLSSKQDYTDCENFDDVERLLYTDYDGFNNVKKNLIITSLVNDLRHNKKNYYIKHIFSIILKNVYSENFYKKNLYHLDLNQDDQKLLKLIDNKKDFEEIFDMFINNEKFSTYLISNFYSNNYDKNMIDFDENERLYKKYNLDEKIKKYYM